MIVYAQRTESRGRGKEHSYRVFPQEGGEARGEGHDHRVSPQDRGGRGHLPDVGLVAQYRARWTSTGVITPHPLCKPICTGQGEAGGLA